MGLVQVPRGLELALQRVPPRASAVHFQRRYYLIQNFELCLLDLDFYDVFTFLPIFF